MSSVFGKFWNFISEATDTRETIYIQKPKQSSNVENRNLSNESSNTPSANDSPESQKTPTNKDSNKKSTSVRSTASPRTHDQHHELNTSPVWKEYISNHAKLQEYDPNWPKMYQNESNQIQNSFKDRSQPLVLDMEHIGSTSVEGMCANPMIDILIICNNYEDNKGSAALKETCDILVKNGYQPRYRWDLTNFDNYQQWMREDGIFLKKGFIIRLVSQLTDNWKKNIGFIAFREYLRTHSNVRTNYNHYKKSVTCREGYRPTIEQYTSHKDAFVSNLVDKAIQWYIDVRQARHIGAFNESKGQWSCCDARRDESNSCGDNYHSDERGCYYSGLRKDSYHPGRFYSLRNNFIRGWYTCCSQGQYSDGCVKVLLLENNDVLLKNCEHWDVNNVCCWVQSLTHINTDYSPNFRRQNITGSILLAVVDDETLEELGVSNVLHRKLFRKAIDTLKLMLPMSTEIATTTPTADLSSVQNEPKNVYYKQFQGDFTPLTHTNKMTKTASYGNVSLYLLTNESHRDILSRIYNCLGQLRNRQRVDKIEYISDPARYRMFLGQLESIEKRQTQPTFRANLNLEDSREERERVLERLDFLCQQVSHNRTVRMVRMWHGCPKDNLPNLLSSGFAALGTFDNGWYGKAMYFTSSAKYAARYCGGSSGCLIMCYVLILNPFPVVSTDAPLNASPQQFRFYGSGNYRNYQCHYIPVSRAEVSDELDYRPPSNGIEDAEYDELAVFQESTILPQFVVYLKQ